MTRLRFLLPLLFAGVCLTMVSARAQGAGSDAAALTTLGKKIDAQNIKIDALSQQILKLQQEVAQLKNEPTPARTPMSEASGPPATAPGGSTHVVTRGETLTSIAHQYKVSIADLQKLNHIQDDRKLQIGQTLSIPGAATPAASATATATPND
jgi:LysM repeat protein